MRSCIARKAGAPRTHGSAPRPIREHMLRIEDDAPARAVSKFVAGRYPRCATSHNKRRSNASARTSIGGHGHSIRIVNETAGGTISWSWHPLFAPRKANLLRERPVLD